MADEAYSPSHPTEQDMDLDTDEEDDNLDSIVSRVTGELRGSRQSVPLENNQLPKLELSPKTLHSLRQFNSIQNLDEKSTEEPVNLPVDLLEEVTISIPETTLLGSAPSISNSTGEGKKKGRDEEKSRSRSASRSPNKPSKAYNRRSRSRSSSSSSYGKSGRGNDRSRRKYSRSPVRQQSDRDRKNHSWKNQRSPPSSHSRRRSRSNSRERQNSNTRNAPIRKSRFHSRSPSPSGSPVRGSFRGSNSRGRGGQWGRDANMNSNSSFVPRHNNHAHNVPTRWNGSRAHDDNRGPANPVPFYESNNVGISRSFKPLDSNMSNRFMQPFPSSPRQMSLPFYNAPANNLFHIPPPNWTNPPPGASDSVAMFSQIGAITSIPPPPPSVNQFLNPHQQILNLIQQAPQPEPISNSIHLPVASDPPPPPPLANANNPTAVGTIMQRLAQMRQNVESTAFTPPPPPPPPPSNSVSSQPPNSQQIPDSNKSLPNQLNELVNTAAEKLFYQLKSSSGPPTSMSSSSGPPLFVPPPLPDYHSSGAGSIVSPVKMRSTTDLYTTDNNSHDHYSPGADFRNCDNDPKPCSSIKSHKLGSKMSNKQHNVSSAFVQCTRKAEFASKQEWQERIAYEMKQALRPHYMAKQITKSQYKQILKKGVNKISKSHVDFINKEKIAKFTNTYVEKYARNSPL